MWRAGICLPSVLPRFCKKEVPGRRNPQNPQNPGQFTGPHSRNSKTPKTPETRRAKMRDDNFLNRPVKRR